MPKPRHKHYRQLCLFPQWKHRPRRSPTFSEQQAEAESPPSFAERHSWFVQGWRAHDFQLRLFLPEE